MKNLVMGVATNYDWYKLEPFVTSFKMHCKNSDLVLFVDNISDFTRAALTGGGRTKILPIPAEFKSARIIDIRWTLYKNFLNERGKNYHQVFTADTRDVIFQGDVFEKFSDLQNFFGYTTEGMNIKNSFENMVYGWIVNLCGKEEAEKLSDKKIICCGTVLGTSDEMKYFAERMEEILKHSTIWGDEQAAENYLVYENQLDIENIIEIDCHSGNIFTSGLFHKINPIEIKDNKILRGSGGVPAVVHQYDRYNNLVELVDKLYRDKNFKPDENFTDTQSMLEQIFYLSTLGRIDEGYQLFTKHLHGKNFVGYVDNLINIWENLLKKNITPASELLMLSIQYALMSTGGNGFNLWHINQIFSLTNFSLKNHLVVSYLFKIFMGNILFNAANYLHDAKQLDRCLSCLNFMTELEIPLDQNYYLLKAKVYRESGKKSEALAAYEKALNV